MKAPHSQTAAEREERLAALLAELTDGAQRGRAIDLEEACREHPDLAEELRELWGAVMLADAAGSQASEATLAPSSSSPIAAIELPCRVDDYELLQEIGRGGMGVVYRARQISLGRETAVKMMRDPHTSPADRERFRSEAEAAARLDHPSIVPVYEVGDFDGQPFFSMKFVAGQTLASILAEGPIAPRRAATILAETARAIQFAHRNGVLHRDIKPSNILIDEEGRAHVTDFGLAKQIEAAASLTKTGAALGTPPYMAPEQAAGARGQVGPASDVYGLGAVLYHMLTGRPPFQAASPVDVVLMVLEQDPVPPRMLNPKADRDLEMIALRCLQKPADLRYDSAGALADDLEAFLAGEPVAARSGRLSQVVAQWFRETHHAVVLQNWGLLWMWHSLVLLIVCALTNALEWQGVTNRWYYFGLWTAALWTWAGVFWALRRRMGPVTFVERQVAHVWAASMAAIAGLFPLEYLMDLPVLSLSPVLGLINSSVFIVKAGILSGAFYVQAVALFITTFGMALFPDYAHLIFGVVSAGCFFFPGLKYYRERTRSAGE